MAGTNAFWELGHLSDAQLLGSLSGVLRTQRRALAEIVAHLGEVEERRLHLQAASSSMFAYCVARLGMSEDEACRRIELARLARRFPALFAELASGRVTLSVALLLKPVMTPSNHLELLAAARGKCIRQARELVAERFPRPDAPSSIRKLPERRPLENTASALVDLPLPLIPASEQSGVVAARAASSAEAQPATPSPPPELPILVPSRSLNAPVPAPATVLPPSPAIEQRALSAYTTATRDGAVAAVSRGTIEPLSAGRYRIQFTADLELKQKLELARDLLRHAHPSGDFAPIVARALELLLADVRRRQFGASPGGKRREPATECVAQPPAPVKAPPPPASSTEPATKRPAPSAQRRARPHIARAVRRAVVERDGLGCSWVDAHGVRCGSRAWLQLDHRQPAGKGGGSEPENLRLLCRAHNRLAAERAYGREHMERASRQRSQTEPSFDQPA